MFEQDSFSEGVTPGGLKSSEEIKLLISYTLKKIDVPVSRMKICDFLLEDGIANYFEINQAITEMVNSGVLLCKKDSEGADTLTLMGGTYFEIEAVEDLIPKSIRQKALNAATKLINREKIENSGNVSIVEANGGYNVKFCIGDENEKLFEMTVFVADRSTAELAKRNFCDKAGYIYSNIMTSLTLE